ncbi:hypothetical protein WA026_010227 [Henosepilachna vigintioctopunctata]|uniref:tRNA (adenine(58)-N(1))-methyltransferase catalytic subunit TRMT61A n=1 Tax=Henosepilachna vigintioctopunctata TaxID=420089 RepID=A0AAW1UII4_9CUCU
MSFDGYKTVIKEGDSVILYLTINQYYILEAKNTAVSKKGATVQNIFQTPYGPIICGDLIGKLYGTKIQLKKGWAYVLQPTPEFWTEILPHRTQIIYSTDISMILFYLELKPTSIVVESGTGSGSLSHAIIRRIKPSGHLYTFDFHETRAEVARNEFKDHGLGEYVTVQTRDVCTNGFGKEMENKADAIFLDLPQPWLAANYTTQVFKKSGGRLCSFSPCVEQVQKMCAALSNLGYQDIQTVEILQSQFSVQKKKMSVLNLNILKTQNDGKCEKSEKEYVNFITSVLPNSLPGHTGYLTSATFPPCY